MVKKQMYMKIQELKRKGKSQRKISKELSLDRKTVAKYLSMTDEQYRQIQAESLQRDKLFAAFISEILEVYERNNYHKLHVSALYDFLEEKHGTLPCTEKTLRVKGK